MEGKKARSEDTGDTIVGVVGWMVDNLIEREKRSEIAWILSRRGEGEEKLILKPLI